MNLTFNILDKDGNPLVADNIFIGASTVAGANTHTAAVTDNTSVTISADLAGYHTYSKEIAVYDYDTTVDIKLIAVITDPLDPEYRKPFPHFFYILEPCTYNIHVYNGQSLPFGQINYYLDGVLTYEGVVDFVLDTCVPAVIEIEQEIVVRTVPNCGGTSPILWDADNTTVYTLSVTTTEYKPALVLQREFNCCELLDTEIAINPATVTLNNTGIHNNCTYTGVTTAIEYTVTDPEGTDTVLATYDRDALVAAIGAGDYSTVGFTYTPTTLGTYSITVDITNCCTTTSTVYTFDVCTSWTITNTTCNILEVSNLSTINSIYYTIKELQEFDSFSTVTVNDVLQANIEVPPGTVTEIDLSIDGLYTVTIDDEVASTPVEDYIFVLDCNIKKCKKQLLLDYLCDGGDDCDELTRSKLRDKYNEFKTLEEIVYQKWDIWKQQQTIYDTFSINDIMEDVITVAKAMEIISKICNSCGISNDCSCEKRYTCSYTLTNAGYLVPTRYATIIVPKNGTDCGCS